MVSDFVLRVLHVASGQYVEWAPGQAMEAQIVDELCDRVRAKGVGLGRSAGHVVDDVRTAMCELLLDFKKRV